MATKIRLKRIGRRNRPFYRVVVMDSRNRRDGAAIEELGWYNPIDANRSYDLKGERIIHWLGEGAIPTDAAHKLMRRAGIAHQWHLIQQGLDEAQIEKEMKKWELNREDVIKSRNERAEKNIEEKSNSVEAEEEAPTEEVAEAKADEPAEEEAPTEEVAEVKADEPVEEETPTEEVAKAKADEPAEEETPTEEVAEAKADEPAEEEAPTEEVAEVKADEPAEESKDKK